MVIPLILLAILATTPSMITEDAFARYQRHTGNGNLNQAASISNSCLNPVSNSNTNNNMISNGNCGGTVSQQGKSGQASTPTTVQNANPSLEVQRSTTTAQPQSPGPGPQQNGAVSLSISVFCIGVDTCPRPNQFTFLVSTSIVSPSQFIPGNGTVVVGTGQQTLTFNNFEVRLVLPNPGPNPTTDTTLFASAPCSNLPFGTPDRGTVITGPIPSAGETVSCNIQIRVVAL